MASALTTAPLLPQKKLQILLITCVNTVKTKQREMTADTIDTLTYNTQDDETSSLKALGINYYNISVLSCAELGL